MIPNQHKNKVKSLQLMGYTVIYNEHTMFYYIKMKVGGYMFGIMHPVEFMFESECVERIVVEFNSKIDHHFRELLGWQEKKPH